MKNKLALIMLVFAGVIIIAAICIGRMDKPAQNQDYRQQQIIAVNEIEQLARAGKNEEAAQKAALLQEQIRSSDNNKQTSNHLIIISAISLAILLIVFIYIYFSILRPFHKMEKFASKIAQGDFSMPLNYERSNYFGQFTWAFDSMRREISKARASEREAIENNKTVIATLSHDIKTPLSSIRAYAEGLEANLDKTPEQREKYLSVLMRKCDEVSKLTDDLFLHSISDLDKIKVNSEIFELVSFMETAIAEIAGEQKDIYWENDNQPLVVIADRKRLMQIIENIINNARKYAKTDIIISLQRSEGNVEIHFRDYGRGIPNEDMPFIFDKFYRGKNSGDEQGSGLGLYIVHYLAEKMNGSVLLHNKDDGLEVIVTLSLALKSS